MHVINPLPRAGEGRVRVLCLSARNVSPTISPMPTLVVAENLIAEYPGIRALDDVSIAIETGSITALVGPNGAGKTTLMRCLCGLERPVDGRVTLCAVDVIEEPRRAHRYVGFLPDFLGLYDELTVAQCLTYAARANGVTAGVATRVTEVAAQLDLSPRLTQRTGELSRGLRQRVAIGQAIIHAPQLLILDEPASGLDPEARHALAALFKSLQSAGMTLLVSSHILAELADYATHMLVLRDGRVVEQRAIKEPAARTGLTIAAIDDLTRLADTLSAQPGVTEVQILDHEVRCRYSPELTAQAQLLAALIKQGVRVTRFGEIQHDLQQSYLATLQRARTDES